MNDPTSASRLADMQARVTLLHLSGMGPARIRWLLSRHDAVDVVARIRAGELPAPPQEAPPGVKQSDLAKWRSEIADLDPVELLQRQFEHGRAVLHPDDSTWPFPDEPEPPLLLFCAGDVDLVRLAQSVAIGAVLGGRDHATVTALEQFAPVHAVLGNNDIGVSLPETLAIEVAGIRIAMIHDSGPSKGRGRRLADHFPDADLVVFGHSHLPWHESIDLGDRVQIHFNPGSPTQRRQAPTRTIGWIEIDDDETIRCHHEDI